MSIHLVYSYVYMRTNIVLNDDLVKEALKYSHAGSKKALIEEALKAYVAKKAEEKRTATYRERVRSLDEKTGALVLRERPHSILRADRERR